MSIIPALFILVLFPLSAFAGEFEIKVIDRASSNKVYLMEVTGGDEPKRGQYFIVRDEDDRSVMALRVLRTYDGQEFITSARVKSFKGRKILETDSEFEAETKSKKSLGRLSRTSKIQNRVDTEELESRHQNLSRDDKKKKSKAFDWVEAEGYEKKKKKEKRETGTIDVFGAIGPTIFSYSESPSDVIFDELTLTVKGGASVEVQQDQVELTGDFFAHFLPIVRSAPDFDPALVMGLNLRAGLNIWEPDPFVSVWLSPGYYYWTMQIPNNSYGIQQLSGLQAYLSARVLDLFPHPVWIHFKFAPIAETITDVGLESREYAFGLRYDLHDPTISKPAAAYPIFLLDIVDLAFQSDDANGTSIDLFSATLSAGLRL